MNKYAENMAEESADAPVLKTSLVADLWRRVVEAERVDSRARAGVRSCVGDMRKDGFVESCARVLERRGETSVGGSLVINCE